MNKNVLSCHGQTYDQWVMAESLDTDQCVHRKLADDRVTLQMSKERRGPSATGGGTDN